ncbi:unnamed protein product [Cuscuta europaea]|uniref:VQ domain-containing protein n=1 Tax=Cuscuta europaea TaxID=41803 RepID=A0A9P0ZH83_CUSEU|nr:unnamed protein product [Cuscuta europaea]
MDSGNSGSLPGGDEDYHDDSLMSKTWGQLISQPPETAAVMSPTAALLSSYLDPPIPFSSSSWSNTPALSSSSGSRNTKKRSRASRRAPTTVLTTDTSNFRAMVQEFTGIPPFPTTTRFAHHQLPPAAAAYLQKIIIQPPPPRPFLSAASYTHSSLLAAVAHPPSALVSSSSQKYGRNSLQIPSSPQQEAKEMDHRPGFTRPLGALTTGRR